MKFPHINNFSTSDPKKLNDELSRFEDNVDRAMAAAAAAASRRLTSKLFNRQPSPGNIVAIQAEQQLLVDTALGDAIVQFPALSPANYGKLFVLLRRSALNNVITVNVDPKVPCNGSLTWPTISGASSRATVFFCDSTGYYK